MRPCRDGAELAKGQHQIITGVRFAAVQELEHHHPPGGQIPMTALLDQGTVMTGDRARRRHAACRAEGLHPRKLAFNSAPRVIVLSMNAKYRPEPARRFNDIGCVLRQVDEPGRCVRRHIPEGKRGGCQICQPVDFGSCQKSPRGSSQREDAPRYLADSRSKGKARVSIQGEMAGMSRKPAGGLTHPPVIRDCGGVTEIRDMAATVPSSGVRFRPGFQSCDFTKGGCFALSSP